jgi:hypothetical protein
MHCNDNGAVIVQALDIAWTYLFVLNDLSYYNSNLQILFKPWKSHHDP